MATQHDDDPLATIPLFTDLPEVERVALGARLAAHAFEADEVVVREGAEGAEMFVLRSGQVRIVTHPGPGGTMLARLGPGEVFGERALFTGEARNAAVVAETEVDCLVLDQAGFDELTAQYPAIRAHIERLVELRVEGRGARGFLNEAYSLIALAPALQRITIGRQPDNDVVVDEPTVAAQHAEIRREGEGFSIADLGSESGTYLNRAPVHEAPFGDGDEIWIGSRKLFIQDGVLKEFRAARGVRVEARGVGQQLGGRQILRDIAAAIYPGELVAIIGASGAGKTTLVHTLIGLNPATSGAVLFDGWPVERFQGYFRQMLGYVPQDDIIHPELTVEQALRYSGRLRLPPDTTAAELEARVTDVLDRIGLAGERHSAIRNLSGGQRKRASIAAELLTQPRILFLDEPTSGLDPRTASRLMALMRGLADEGRTVIFTTHATNDIAVCDRLIAVAGGRIAFAGTPAEALEHFDAGELMELYDHLAEQDAGALAEAFHGSPAYTRNITSRLITPHGSGDGAPNAGGGRSFVQRTGLSALVRLVRQYRLLLSRDLRLLLADRGLLAVRLLAAPALAAVLLLLFDRDLFALSSEDGGDVPSAITLLYIVGLLALFLGAAINAATEITRESAIFRRERLVGLSAVAYVASKATIFGVLAFFQAVLLVGVLAAIMELPSPSGEVAVKLALGVWLTALTGVGLGLLVSAVSRNAAWALSLTVILLIPQIFFAGTIPRSDMNEAARRVSDVTMSKWSLELLAGITDLDSRIDSQRTICEDFFGQKSCYQPIEHPLVRYINAFGGSLRPQWTALGAFFVVFIGLTMVVQAAKGRRRIHLPGVGLHRTARRVPDEAVAAGG